MSIKRIEYTNNKRISASKSDLTNNGIWITFAKDSDNNVIIERQSAFDPEQNFFSLTRTVDAVNDLDIDSSNLYVAYSDTTLLGEIISLNNPLTITITISRPVGLTEDPVAILVNATDLFFLIPGILSGENASILRYDTSGVLQETIELTKTAETVINASTMDLSDIEDIWVGTNTDPAQFVRVFELSGGGFDFEVNEIL